MNSNEINYLLIHVIEECSEVIKAATKCMRFGIGHTEPDYGHNGHELAKEMGQVFAAYDMLCHHGSPNFPISAQGTGYHKKHEYLRLWLESEKASV